MFDVGAAADVVAVLAKAARAEVSFVDDDALLDEVRVLERCRRLLDAAELRRLARLEADGTCEVRFGMATSGWLAHECELPVGVARRRVRCAMTLRTHLPVTAEALTAGEIGFEHAEAMCRAANPRVIDDVAAIEHELLRPIPLCTFERWHAELRGVAEQLDQDGGYDPNRDRDANRLHKRRGANNGLYLRGAFFGEHADRVEQAIDDAADGQFRLHNNDREVCDELVVPARSTLQALGLVELCRLGRANTTRPTGAPADIAVVIETDQWRRPTARTTNGTVLADEVMRLVGCDATFATVILDGRRAVLDMGRTQRLATPEQRKAVRVRDGGCVFPGCDAHPNHCDVHHIRAWEHGGTSDIANLAGLCRHHHGVTHRRGWTMTASDDQTFTWTTPAGHTLRSQRHQTATGPPGAP